MLQAKIQIEFQVETNTNTNIDNIMTNTKFGLFNIASSFGPTSPSSSADLTRTNWPRQVRELNLDSDSWS